MTLWVARSHRSAGGSDASGNTLDIHVHLFGTGDTDSGCFLSPTITEGAAFKILVTILDIYGRAGRQTHPTCSPIS